jgi:Mg-chelatase subunit ChlD
MPKFQDDATMENHAIGGSHFQFSAARIDDLGASEYTLGIVAVDISGSTSGFLRDMEGALTEIIKASRTNPRADNMMLRVVLFDSRLQEFHGFKPLPNCNESDYTGALHPGGTTALYDAVYEGVKSAITYGKALVARDYSVNAVIFVITDGQDNASTVSAKMVKEALAEAVSSEALESMMSVLIGVGVAGGLDQYLKDFQTDAGFQQYVGIANADTKTLAKLGGFISQSMSSQSKSLGSGGPSKSLSF